MTRATGDDETIDPAVIDRRMRERVEQTTRRQAAIAADRLDDDRHQALETLCRNLTEGILGGPLSALKLAEECDSPELALAVAKLFDVESAGVTPDAIEHETGETAPPIEH